METHERFIARLVFGFAGNVDPEVRPPAESGAPEAEAVARWAANNLAHHVHHECRYDPMTGVPGYPLNGGFVAAADMKVWKRWDWDGAEDLTLAVYWDGQLTRHRVKVTVDRQAGGPHDYFLRLRDWTVGQAFDVSGVETPADPSRTGDDRGWAMMSYAACVPSLGQLADPRFPDGYGHVPSLTNGFPDGTSNTLIVVEGVGRLGPDPGDVPEVPPPVGRQEGPAGPDDPDPSGARRSSSMTAARVWPRMNCMA